MNEEAIQHAYDLFTNDGYTKSVDEFKTLMSSNPDALAHSYGLFQSDGYSKSLEEFQALMAGNQVKEEVKKKDSSTDTPLPTEGGESVSGGSDLLDTSIQDREAQGHQTDISLFTDGSDKDTVAAAAEQERGIFYEEQGLDFKKINELKKRRKELEEEKNVYQENVLNTKFELNGGIKKDDKFFIPKDKGFFESQKTIEEGGYDEVTKDKALDFATGTTAVNMAMTIGDYVLPGGGSEGDRSERSILDDIGSVEEELNESRPQVIKAEEAYNTQITNSFLEQGYRGERLNQLMENADIKQEYVESKLFTINGAESTGVTIEEGIYDDDFISGLQDGSIKVDIHPSIKDTDYGRYLENAIAVQSNAGGELGDIKDAFMAGGFGTVAGTLEVLEIGEGVDSSLEYSDKGGIVAREFKDVQDQYTDMQRMYQYPGFMQSFRAGEYADAGFQLGRGIAGSTVQIGISYIGRKLKIPQKYLMGFIGVSAAGQKSLSLKEQRREGNLDMSNFALATNALLSGAAEAVWEIPTFQIIEGIQQITKGAGKAAVRDVTKKAVDGLLKDLLKEGGSEAGTTVTEMIVDHVTGAGTPESFDEIVNEVGNAFVTGVGMAGGMRAVGGSAAVTASVINKLTGVDLTNRIVATIKTVNEDGSLGEKQELTQAEYRKWRKDPKNLKAQLEGGVNVEVFNKDIEGDLQDLVDSASEDVVDANESVDVVGREVNSEINELGNDLKDKDSAPSEGRVSKIAQLLNKMGSLIDGSSSNRGVDLKALKDVFNDMMSKAGFSVNDNVTNQNTDNANIESTENITEIQSKEQANAIEKALDKGENLSVVLSQDGVGVSKDGKSVSKNNIKLGEFKSKAAAKKALDAFNKKNAEQKQKRHVEVQKKNNKEFKKADKGKMDDVSQEDLDGDFNIMSAELDGLDAATNDKRTDNLEKVLKNKGLKYKKVTTIENGVSKTSFMVEGVESNQALSIASGFGQKSITSSKDGVLHSDGTVEALDGNTYDGPNARDGARVIVIKQNGKKKAIRLGTGKKSFAKKFNSNNIADIAKFVEYLPENQKKILGHVLNFFSKIQGLNIGIVKNTYAMKLQLEADGYSPEDINKYAGNRAIYRGSDGTMYLNLEVMNMNTAFHEIIHPLVDFIKNTDSETRNKAIKEIEESQAYKDADAEGKKQMIDTIPKGVYSKIEDMVSKAEPGMIGSPFRKRWIDSNGRRQSGSYLDWVKGQKAYKDLSRKAQIEEAFAEMMGDAAANQFQKDNSKLKQIYDAIREMLYTVFNANIPEGKNLASLDLSDLQNIGDLRSGIGSALAKGTSLNVGGVDFTFSKTEGEIREQAADLLSEKENLADFGLDSEKRNTLRTLGAALDTRQRKKYKVINKGTTTDKASDYISDFIKDEVIYSIDNIEDSGLGWYEEKYQRALNNLAEVNDFMKEGEPSRDLFTMLLAITSDGIEVSKNLEFAEILTKEYVETGSIDSSKIKFGGKSRKSMVTNVNNIIDLLNQFDGDMMKVKEFLTVEKSVSEFKKDYPKMVKKSEYQQTGASADKIKLPMAAMIFGPKLGAFYGNLTGGAGYLTMDRWFSRTFNRYRGIVKTPLDKKRYDRAREAILKLKDLEKKYNLDYGIKLSSSKNLSKDNVVSTAKKIASLYVKNNKRRESLPEELKKNESLLNSFATDYGGLQDSPFNKSDRTFMYESVWKAQEKLAKEGRDVTVADIQAILWYFEKSLYKKFNVQGPPIISYEEATLRAIPDFKAQAPQVEEVQWQESRIGRGDLAITNRSEEVRESAQDYFDKKITLQDHLDVIQENSPIKPITQFMNPASLKDIKTAVGSKVEGKLDVSIQEGTKVGVRLDISAYTNKNIWTITVHEDGRGKAMSYTNVARINNVEFISSPKVALNIARGKSSKATIARILGEWSPLEGADAKARGESAKQIVVEVMNDPSWSQIGMNPFRHSYFYDRLDGMPVVNAEQVVQIGGLVYAKNAEKTTPFDERFEDKRTGLKFQADDNDGFTGGRSQYARFNVTPNTDRPNALIEDLSEDRVSEIAMKGNWSIITGTVEAEGKYNNEANVSNNAKLYKELVEEFGTENIEVVQGVYMREDQGPSLFVTGITEHRAMQIGKSYSQEGVLTRRGNIFTDGSGMNPASETVFVGDNALNKDGNSTTTSGVTFSLDVDWGTKVPLATGIKAQAMDNMEYTSNAKAATDKVGPLRFQSGNGITEDQLTVLKSTYSDIEKRYPNINLSEGMVKLYHYSDERLNTVDPRIASRQTYSNQEYRTWGRSRVFFYTDADIKEGVVGGSVMNETLLPIDRVYPLTEDPLNLEAVVKNNLDAKRNSGDKTQSTITLKTKSMDSSVLAISKLKSLLKDMGLSDVVDFGDVTENFTYSKDDSGKYQRSGIKDLSFTVNYPIDSDNITSVIKDTFDNAFFEKVDPATIPFNYFEEMANVAEGLGFQGFIYDHVGGKTVSSWKPVSVVGDRFQAASQEDTDVYVSGLGAIMWDLAKPIIDADYKLGGWASNVRKPDRRYKKKDSEGLMVSTVRATELFLMPKGLHTNQQIKEMIIAGRAQLNHQLYVANKNQKNLKKVIEAEEKRIKSEDSYKNATPEQQEAMLEHLTPEALNNTMSSVDAILALPEQSKLREAMTTVRNHIDVLSITMYEEGLVSGPMRYTIEGNLGYYLTRSYNQYEDSDWRQKDQEVIRRAEVFVMNKLMSEPKNMSREDAEVRAKIMVNNIVNQKDSEIGIKFIKNSGISRPLHRVGSIFEKRNEALPKEIRELLGERMDPLTNYVNTVSKLSRTLISNQMYEDMIDFGMGKFISDPTLDDPEISMMGQEVNNKLEGKKWGPLDGKFVDNEMLDVLKFYDDADGEMGLATKAWMTFVFATKKAATVYNPATHAVNLFGNSYFSLLNGHTSPAKFFESFRVAAGQITNLNGKERQAFYEELISLGVVDSSASLAEIVEIGKDLIKEGVDMNKIMDKLGNRMAGKSAKFLLATAGKADKVATSAYQAEDDLFKIFGYLSEKAKYMESGLSEKESKSRAVRNTANLYPNYGRIPAIIRAIGRNNFVGTFVSFTSESIRCTKNALKLSLDEMGDPNPKIKKMGAKRLAASLLTLKFAESLTSTAISMLFGAFGDDEEEFHKELFGLRHLVAPWDKDGKIAPINKGFFERGMDGFTEENNGHAFVEYMNTSRLSGGGFVKDLLRIAFTDMNSPDYKNTMGRILYKFYSAFLSEDMALGVVREIIENKGNKYYNPTDHFLEISWDVLTNGLFYKLGPGIFKSGVRIQESMQEGSDKITSNEIRAMFGLRTTTLDVNNSLFFKSKEIIKDMTDRSKSLEFDLRQKDMTLAYTLNPNHEMFDNKMSQYFNGLVSAVQTARRLGVNISGTKDNCIDMLKKANVPQEVIDKVIYNVLNGEGSETLRIGDK